MTLICLARLNVRIKFYKLDLFLKIEKALQWVTEGLTLALLTST
jgi:hypothetical protein